jgi:hypothetical protein
MISRLGLPRLGRFVCAALCVCVLPAAAGRAARSGFLAYLADRRPGKMWHPENAGPLMCKCVRVCETRAIHTRVIFVFAFVRKNLSPILINFNKLVPTTFCK